MSSYMTGELLLFARAVWYGACLLLLYDVLRILRRTIHHGPVWTAVEDILYWVFCAVWLFSRFYQENDGILRAYFFAGIFLGALACRASISRFFVGFGVWLLTACGKILGIPLKGAKRMIKRLKIQLFRFKINLNVSLNRKKEKKVVGNEKNEKQKQPKSSKSTQE